MLSVLAVVILVSCGNSNEDTDELLPRDARPDLIFATQERDQHAADAVLVGALVERDDCLRIVSADGTDYVIAWPHGFSWEVGGMGSDMFVVVRNGTAELAAKAGDIVRLFENVSTQEIDGCSGPVWSAGETIDIVTARSDGLFSPTPTLDQLGSYTLQFMLQQYAEDRSNRSEIVLSRAMTPREVYDIVADLESLEVVTHTQAGARYCEGHPFPGSWYCDTGAAPFIVIVRGDWWTHDNPSTWLGQYLAVLIDRHADNPAPIMVGYIASCHGESFTSLLDASNLPDVESDEEC